MNYFLTEEQEMIVEVAKKIAEEKIKPLREHYDETGEFPWEAAKAMAEADLCGLYIPEAYGGMGGGVFELCLAVEELCKVDGGIALALAQQQHLEHSQFYYLVMKRAEEEIFADIAF
jgi:alkylation response protein AidB-like acyl-CoA dehydrogenase